MAGNARFHDKHHRTNHHTLSTVGIPDSATDPIASPSQPFQGDFVVNGLLSSSKGLDVLSANYGGDVYCENIYVRNTTFTDFISGVGTETIISDGALTGYGPNTLTMDFGTAIYLKTPIVNFTNSISAASAIYTNFGNFSVLSSSSISAKDIITNTLSSISLSSNDILTNTISSNSLSSQTILSDTVSSRLISATNIEVLNNLTVSGNCLIYGNLSALGDLTEIETTLHSSSSFSITNTDVSLPALTITQTGSGDIVVLNYSTIPNFLKIDIEKLTINGKISALSGIHSDVSVTSPNISSITSISNSVFSTVSTNSANWKSTYSNVSSNSANWTSTYSNVSSNSAAWTSTYTTVSSNSANWESTYSNVSSNSANSDSTYTTVSTNSAKWESTYSNVSSYSANWDSTYSAVSTNSANWVSTYSNVSANSANWVSAYSTVSTNSANWDSTYSNVSTNSANWESTYSNVSSNSANWDSTYINIFSISANWESTYSTVSTNSANWTSAYSTVSTNSANWETTYSNVSSNSANWTSTYSNVSSNSAAWTSTYTTVSTNSANWESTKTTVYSNSANWLSGSNTLHFVASSIKTDTVSANVLSANVIRVYQAIHVSVSALSVIAGSTTTMTVNSPSYFFVNVTSAGTANFNLPSTNSNNIGMLFFIKNVSLVNNRIVSVNNAAGTPLTNGVLNGNGGHYIEVVWDGTNWQQISHI
jgi:hypothetical protein